MGVAAAAAAVIGVLSLVVVITARLDAGASSQGAAAPTTAPPDPSVPSTEDPVTTTSTTPPVEPASVDGRGVTFLVGAGSSATVSVSAPCWIGITTDDGSPPFQTTLLPGETHSEVIAGTTRVRLGNPGAVTVQIDGVDARVPLASSAPIDIVLATHPS